MKTETIYIKKKANVPESAKILKDPQDIIDDILSESGYMFAVYFYYEYDNTIVLAHHSDAESALRYIFIGHESLIKIEKITL
jgi:hypothetical protein